MARRRELPPDTRPKWYDPDLKVYAFAINGNGPVSAREFTTTRRIRMKHWDANRSTQRGFWKNDRSYWWAQNKENPVNTGENKVSD